MESSVSFLAREQNGASGSPNYECDCCVPDVRSTCKVFFFGYIILMTATIIVLFNYRNVRMRSNQPAVMRRTSKFWIVVAVMTLQFVRILYFSTAWFSEKFDESVTSRCAVEFSISMPVMLEYLNMFIIHEFLIRLHLVVTDSLDKYRVTLIVYTVSLAIFYFLSSIISSIIYCEDTSMLEHSRALKRLSLF